MMIPKCNCVEVARLDKLKDWERYSHGHSNLRKTTCSDGETCDYCAHYVYWHDTSKGKAAHLYKSDLKEAPVCKSETWMQGFR